MKEKLPFVSVVIASFNRKYIIEESISSALNQDYPKEDFEVIVVDNNSTDGTVNEVLNVFPKEIKEGKLKLVPLTYNSGSSGSYVEALFHLNPKWQYLLKMMKILSWISLA